MPLTLVFSCLLFFGTAFWSFVPPLLFLVMGFRWNVPVSNSALFYSNAWIQAGLLIFLASAGTLLFGYRKLRTALENEARLGAGLCVFFLYCAYSLQRIQAELTSGDQPVISFQDARCLYWAAGLFFLVLALFPTKKEGWILGGVCLFLLVHAPILIRHFSFENGLSDVFLDIREACRNLLSGISPYGLEKTRPWQGGCSYFPGLWLSYLPAVALKVDLRYLSCLYQILFGLVVWNAIGRRDRLLATWLLALFLLNPWYLLRHDVYKPAYLLIWALFYGSLRAGRDKAAARWFGFGLAAHPFHWALLPIWFAWMAKAGGFKKAFSHIGQACTVAALFLIPFILWNPLGFYEGVIGHFLTKGAVNISHFGLVVWFTSRPGLLAAAAIFGLGSGVLAVWRGPGTLESLFRWMAASLGFALLCSYHIEHYYFLGPLALTLFHQVTVLDPVKTSGPPIPPVWSWEEKRSRTKLDPA